MKLTQQVQLPLTPQQTWSALHDVNVLQACIPGCKSFRAVAADEFDIRLAVRAGPVDLKFQGRVLLREVDPGRSYTLRFDDGSGRSRGEARVRLEAHGRNGTLLHYTAHIALRGWIAHFGVPLWLAVAQQVADDFFRRFRQRVQALPAPPIDAAAAS